MTRIVVCTMPQCQTTAGCICGLATAPIGAEIPMGGVKTARDIERAIGDLVDLCAANPVESKAVDPRAWAQLLIYAGFGATPKH